VSKCSKIHSMNRKIIGNDFFGVEIKSTSMFFFEMKSTLMLGL